MLKFHESEFNILIPIKPIFNMPLKYFFEKNQKKAPYVSIKRSFKI
jgi:hypothetical protein